MSFIETPTFPLLPSYGASGGPEFKTEVVQLNSGWEQRNPNWNEARSRYTIALPLQAADLATLIAWFRSVRGRAHGFRLRDWTDYQCDVTTGRVGAGVGSGLPTYQLFKHYTAGSLSSDRTISKPQYLAAIALYRNAVLQTAGAGAGNYALDTTTGVVTFVADLSQNVTAVTINANPVITLAAALTGLIAGSKLYLTGLGGSVSGVLNGLAHSILSVSGAQYTIATSTLGLAYSSGGIGRKYAQATDALTWAGQFDVPVRFDTDYADLQIEGPNFNRGQSLTLVEIRV